MRRREGRRGVRRQLTRDAAILIHSRRRCHIADVQHRVTYMTGGTAETTAGNHHATTNRDDRRMRHDQPRLATEQALTSSRRTARRGCGCNPPPPPPPEKAISRRTDLEERPVFERVLGRLHVALRRVADERRRVVAEVLAEDVEELPVPAVLDAALDHVRCLLLLAHRAALVSSVSLAASGGPVVHTASRRSRRGSRRRARSTLGNARRNARRAVRRRGGAGTKNKGRSHEHGGSVCDDAEAVTVRESANTCHDHVIKPSATARAKSRVIR